MNFLFKMFPGLPMDPTVIMMNMIAMAGATLHIYGGDLVVDTHVKIDDASIECSLDGHNCKLCLDYAAKVPVTDSFQTVGGNAANFAMGTSRLGLNSTIISTIGDDSNGKIIISELKKNKVNTAGVIRDKKSKTRYSVVLNFQGERTILSYHNKKNYQWPKKMPKSDWIYYTSLSDGFAPLQKNLVKFLKQNKEVKLAFNPGSFQLKYNINLCKEILPLVDLLIVNLEEAKIISGVNLNQSAKTLVEALLGMGVKEVVITDGARGAFAGNADGLWEMAPYDVPIVSKTGAGDSFSAGFMSAKILGHDTSTCLIWGTANSCSVLGHFGVEEGQLDQKGIKKMIEKYKAVQPVRL
ncbi:MAG: carbohydrate kinase family protein [Candidatus Magasanikbacteria bacterium]|nr:carbohydrate kinase family protein [Candidatus Magasanikbacteria bacterium]